MNDENALIDALKILLKQQKKTYRDVSEWLELSEGSVKRLFSQSDMSIERLMLILTHLGRDINDLVATMNANSRQISQISEAQEKELVNDPPAMLTALAVLSDLSFEEIVRHYGFDEVHVENALLKLDKMQIITLLPNNRYQLNVHPHFRWLAGGPIQQYFMMNLASNFVSEPLQINDELLLLSGMLGDEACQRLDWLINDFTQRFQQLNNGDRALPLNQKEAVFLVLAKRHNWYSGVR